MAQLDNAHSVALDVLQNAMQRLRDVSTFGGSDAGTGLAHAFAGG